MVFPTIARGEYYSSRSRQSDSVARTASLQPGDVWDSIKRCFSFLVRSREKRGKRKKKKGLDRETERIKKLKINDLGE